MSAGALAVGLLAIPVLLLLNAVCVAAEFALVSIRKTRVKELVARGIPRARSLERVLGGLDRYLATTQLGITLASIGLGWLGEPALAELLHGPAADLVGERFSSVAAHSAAFGVAFLCISFLHIILGELVPRTIALQSPARIALGLVIPLRIMESLLRPLVWLLNHSGRVVVRAFGSREGPGRESQVHSVTELALMVEASGEAGVLEPQERAMMHGVLAFGDKTVGQIMTPRSDMVCVSVEIPPEDIAQLALETGYSRLPVWGADPEDVVGILNTRDLLGVVTGAGRGLMVVQDLLRKPYFVRKEKRVLDMLREFQRGEVHMALVLDEFGEMAGLVTIEDLLEEIVGDIRDERDAAEGVLKLQRDGSYLAEGTASLRAVFRAIGREPPRAPAGSLSEFVAGQHGGALTDGIAVEWGDLGFTVAASDGFGGARLVRIVKGPHLSG